MHVSESAGSGDQSIVDIVLKLHGILRAESVSSHAFSIKFLCLVLHLKTIAPPRGLSKVCTDSAGDSEEGNR